MSRATNPEPCWVVRDADGKPWDDEWDTHHDTSNDAEVAISEVKDDMEGDPTPEEFAATMGESRGPEVAARTLASEQRRVAHVMSLHPVVHPEPCCTITCDGPNCGTEPEGEYGGTLHFGPGGEFVPDDWDFVDVGGLHFCDDCRITMVCGDCGGLSGDGAVDRDGACLECWDKDQRLPGAGQGVLLAPVAPSAG